MPRYLGRTDYSHAEVGGTGVLVVNLGTPEAPTAKALRTYLGEFLWDPRVVEIPRPLWWLILHGGVLRLRPRHAAGNYAKIWTDEGSPLLAISRHQVEALGPALAERLPGPVEVVLAMRYGKPSIPETLRGMQKRGLRRLLVLPLYPQYAAATTGSVFDAVSRELSSWRWVPELRMIGHYHDRDAYIQALANSIRGYWDEHGQASRLMLSFHGLPKRVLQAGDPYYCECQKTARLVVDRLGLQEGQYGVAFQSRFGREEWLTPYADKTLESWAKDGIRDVDVVCPGFSADCLETLEEVAMTNRQVFLDAGGQSYRYIPALNDRPDHIAMLADLAVDNLQGWPEADAGFDASARQKEVAQSQQRALRQMGNG